MYEVDVPIEMEGTENDQYDSEDSSDVFLGPATERHLMRLQILSQVW